MLSAISRNSIRSSVTLSRESHTRRVITLRSSVMILLRESAKPWLRMLLGVLLSASTLLGAPGTAVAAAQSGTSLSASLAHRIAATNRIDSCGARPVATPSPRTLDSRTTSILMKRISSWQNARRSRIAGLSAAIRWDDGREFEGVAGTADRSSGRLVSPETPFALASVSKPFTAAVALLLDSCGVLPLGTRAKSLVPQAEVNDGATAEDLLRHESEIGRAHV